MKSLKNEIEDYAEDFDGVFRFTNATDEDFVTLWNNKEYTYLKGTTTPMIIANESLENIQQIRKYFAKRLAEREFFKGKDFNKMKNGTVNASGGGNMVASMYDEKLLQPWIDQCLEPLPIARQIENSLPAEKLNVKASKAIGSGNKDNPFPATDLNAEFQESNAQLLAQR